MFLFQIYIKSKELGKAACVRVKENYRIAVFSEEIPGSVAYKFDKKQVQALGYVISDKNVTVLPIDTTISFGLLPFPYVFSVAAFFDTSKHY